MAIYYYPGKGCVNARCARIDGAPILSLMGRLGFVRDVPSGRVILTIAGCLMRLFTPGQNSGSVHFRENFLRSDSNVFVICPLRGKLLAQNNMFFRLTFVWYDEGFAGGDSLRSG